MGKKFNLFTAKGLILPVLFLAIILPNIASAAIEGLSASGSARIRYEGSENKDYHNASEDGDQFTASRFRLGLNYDIKNGNKVFFQPQFTKTWGSPSGSLTDSTSTVHQAYLHWNTGWKDTSIRMGRMEFNYGDQLLVGGVGWHNTGRSFDAFKFNANTSWGNTDIFMSKITEVSQGTSDADFYGFYHAFDFDSDWFKTVDIYTFYNSDRTAGAEPRVIAHGARLKSKVGSVDYRAEGTYENTSRGSEKQYNLEFGLNCKSESKMRTSIEAFYSSEGFAQLYPTGHKWLGIGDFFSRRNISGARVGVSGNFSSRWSAKADVYEFRRTSRNAPAYNFSGTALGTSGTDKKIAREYDFVTSYKLEDNLNLSAGYAFVDPLDYTRTNSGPNGGNFFFGQVNATF